MRSEEEDERLLAEMRRLRHRVEGLEERLAAVAGAEAPRGEARVRTFVAGLDEALGGGIPQGHVVLLHGPAGTMKTSLALHVASRNRAEGVRPLFVSLEETRESLQRTMRGLAIPEDDFIVDLATMRVEHGVVEEAGDWFQILRSYLQNKAEEGLDLLVIDPLNSLYPMASLAAPRRELFHFFRFLREAGLTSLLVYEGTEFPYQEEYLADGVLEVTPRELPGGKVVLWMRCVKMRQAPHSRGYRHLIFEGGQFRAAPTGASE